MISSAEFSEPKSRQERAERRARLERESEIVKAQIQELKNRLPQLYKAGAPSKQGNVSKKRPAPAGGELVGENKRQRVELERARRVNGIWQQCQTILKGLSKSKDAHPFLKPVDVKYSKCPDYFDIIKQPMDLGTIQKKFPGKGKQALRPSDPNTYSTPYEFRDDMRLVWSNCRTYNPPHVPVRNMGEAMSDQWEKRWSTSMIESKWEEEMHRQNLEEQDLAGGGDMAQQMHINHEALVRKVAVSESNPGYTAASDGGPMSFEQKRRLSIAIGQLPGDKVSEVLRIISEDESMRVRADSEEEIEVDIDSLSTELLWKLDRYTRGVAQSVKKKSSKPTAAQQGSKPAATPDPAAGTPQPFNGKEEKSGQHSSSSSSSGDSGTDRSESGSQGEVGSKDLGFPPKPGPAQGQQRRPSETGNDAVTLISATTPAGQPQIVKTMALKKEVNLQNENAWADLGKDKGEDGEGEDGDNEDKDLLWDEFKSREQEEQQRENEKKAEEARQQQERQQKEEAAQAEAEARAKAAEAAKKAQKEEEAAKVKAQRDKEMEEIQNARGDNFEAGAQELMDSKKQGDTLNVLGLQRRESSDEDSDDSSSS